MIDRDELDNLARDLLGRPLTAAEYRDLIAAIEALRLKSGSPIAVLLVLFQSLQTAIAAATAEKRASAEARAKALRRSKIRGSVAGAVLALSCLGLGHISGSVRMLREERAALHWALTADGQRARRMSDSGLLKALDDCAIPGWTMRDGGCVPGVDPVRGVMLGIRTRATAWPADPLREP